MYIPSTNEIYNDMVKKFPYPMNIQTSSNLGLTLRAIDAHRDQLVELAEMIPWPEYMLWDLGKEMEDPGPPPTMQGLDQQIAGAQTLTFGGLQYAPTSNPITYTYPDGSTSTTKPIDNQVFIIWDHQGQQIKSTWQWNEGKQVWHLASSVDDFSSEDKMDKPKLKCECGSEAVGSNRHSNWCPFHL